MVKNCKAVLFAIIVSIMFTGFLTQQVAANGTQISVIPANQIVGHEGVEPPTELFTVNITLTDFVDVYTWQIRLLFDPALLNVTGASYPSDHIFAGETTSPVAPNIGTGYVLFGNSLVGDVPGKTGASAILCQIELQGIAVGISTLTFQLTGAGYTFLLNTTIDGSAFIPFTVNTGTVQIIPEFSGVILAIFATVTTAAVAIGKRTFRKQSK